MKRKLLIALCSIVTVLSCSSPVTTKVLILGRGKIVAKENEISMTDGAGYTEEKVEISGDKAVTWNVTTPSGKTTVNIPADKGFYILNLKTDTVVGSEQNMKKDLGGRTISQEELKRKIDSLTKLSTGANVSDANHNYFIVPNQLTKISANTEAQVFGPFNKIPGTLEADKNGNTPEIYKFYTNGELRELLVNLKKMTF